MAPHKTSNGHNPAKSKDTQPNNPNGKRPTWTIMFYLAGDGNLSAHCITVLQQLDTLAYRENIRVLACFDSNTPAAKGSRYLELHRDVVPNGLEWGLHNNLVAPEERSHQIDAPNFCNGQRPHGRPLRSGPVAAEGVKRFIEWAVEKQAEKHGATDKYMLIFVGHGPIVASETFLAKQNPPSSLLLTDLRKVLGKHFGPKKRKLDILAFNNCFMNGIETAYEVKDLCDVIIGSQGLVLADGWPYQKMIDTVGKNSAKPTQEIARKMLEACARNLLDFTLMERSSEQAVCDLTKLSDDDNVVESVKSLIKVLKKGLAFRKNGDLRYPAICDAVKLARLDAQSYWSETFVDLYDFCERLLKKCEDLRLFNATCLTELRIDPNAKDKADITGSIKKLHEIGCSCQKVLNAIKRMVPCEPEPYSYYIGPELQYSHGLSIYFPWTRPEAPYFFTKRKNSSEYLLRTPFETYRHYRFDQVSGWSSFLKIFFKASLRRVRRAERDFTPTNAATIGSDFFSEHIVPQAEMLSISLQKSSSDTGDENGVGSPIKNYPRRNYLSPADCKRSVDKARAFLPGEEKFPNETSPPVSYLGWNLPGLIANLIKADALLESEPSGRGPSGSGSNGNKAVRPLHEKTPVKV